MTNLTAGEILELVIREDEYEKITNLIRKSSYQSELPVLVACIISISHLGRRFGRYPKDLKEQFWQSSQNFPISFELSGAKQDTLEDLRHFGLID